MEEMRVRISGVSERIGRGAWWISSLPKQQLGSCCPPPPSRQDSRGKGLVIKERSLYSKLHNFGITAFHTISHLSLSIKTKLFNSLQL